MPPPERSAIRARRRAQCAAAAATLSAALGAPVRLSLADAPLDLAVLTPEEQATWRALPGEPRQRDWLLGRAALRLLAGGPSSAFIDPLGARASLTHAAGIAIAAVCERPVTGLGVDFEPAPEGLDARAARFFLAPAEQRWIRDLPPSQQSSALLRLWTVKEALFKAAPDNAALMIGDFAVRRPAGAAGTAAGPADAILRYASIEFASGFLSIAVSEERAHVAV